MKMYLRQQDYKQYTENNKTLNASHMYKPYEWEWFHVACELEKQFFNYTISASRVLSV